jgi:hypothetical protein
LIQRFDALVTSSAHTTVGDFSVGGNVFGLADDGTTMFAVQGQNIYSVKSFQC